MDALSSSLADGRGVTTQPEKQTLSVDKLLTVAAGRKHIKRRSKIANWQRDVAVQL
jgi:hypothetical protein